MLPDRDADVLLADGSTVHIRQIGPEDAAGIVDLHSRFSERTRYLRYFSPYPRIPERDLRRFVNVDHRDREALVVSSGGRLIAVGRYERLAPEADEAEVAFVVEDAHQGRGIGSVLLEHLAEAARSAGIVRFVAEVLPVNSGMLRVFGDAGYQIQRAYADGVVHLEFPIAPTERSVAVQHRREHTTEAASIARLLSPSSVAVYGARRDGTGIGAALVRNLASYTGLLHIVHSGQSLTEPADLALVAVPAPAVPAAVADAAAAGVAGVVVYSAGFAESGPAGAAVQRELLAAARAAGIRLIGPNCLGLANTDPAVRLNATFALRLPARGGVGFFCQSGALGVALLAEADRRGLGLSSFVSAGNRADVSGNDLLQYWQDDPATDAVLLYLETFGNPRKFTRLARRLGRHKPLVAVAHLPPAGPTPDGPAPDVAASDGAAPGPAPDGVALLRHSGVIRVDTVAELFDVGVLLAGQPLPAGERVGIVTNSSALGVLASGVCAAAGLTVTIESDTGARGDPGLFAEALHAALADPEVDAVVVACAPPLPGSEEAAGLADAIAGAAGGDKPVVATLVAGTGPAGVPAYPSVEEAVRALARVARYARWRREPPGELPQLSLVDDDDPLVRYGIAVVPSRGAMDADGAVAAGEALGFPVALKVADPRLRHRIDLGAVRLGLPDAAAVRAAYAELTGLPEAPGAGPSVIVQPMVPPGVSWVVEAVQDPRFGPVVGFGPGGVTGELLDDRAWRPAPLTDRDAAALVREPRSAALLFGHRGARPVAVGDLEDLLLRVGRLIDDHPEVRRLSLNPVLARPDGLSVLHATVHYGPEVDRPDTGPRRLRA